MVLILDGSSERGAHAYSETGNSMCFRGLFRLAAVANLKFIYEETLFTSCVRKVPSYHLI